MISNDVGKKQSTYITNDLLNFLFHGLFQIESNASHCTGNMMYLKAKVETNF